jgi:hypothetical protein
MFQPSGHVPIKARRPPNGKTNPSAASWYSRPQRSGLLSLIQPNVSTQGHTSCHLNHNIPTIEKGIMSEQEAITKAKLAILENKRDATVSAIQSKAIDQREFEKILPLGVGNEIDMTTPQITKEGSKWLVTFQCILPPDIILLPSLIRVEIDDLTRQAIILPSF